MDRWIQYLKNDDYIGIKKYLKDGADVDDADENGQSVLSLAIRYGCEMDTINLLIDAGADIEDFDNEGVSIFDMAISHNHKDMFDYLIEQGIDVDKTTRKSRFTPLMAAASYGRADMLKALLQNGANKDAVDKHGFKAIDFARKMNKKSILKLLDN